jgi:NAD(P)-dependent dehydrogenase (short-subunit alcohol dehydrogenase family)
MKPCTPAGFVTPRVCLEHVAKEHTPSGRFDSPGEAADDFVFLCSRRASYCRGATCYLDSGWLSVTT